MFLHIFRFQGRGEGGGRIVPSRRIAFAAALLSGYSVQCRSMILAWLAVALSLALMLRNDVGALVALRWLLNFSCEDLASHMEILMTPFPSGLAEYVALRAMLTDGLRGGLPWERLLYARTYLSSLAVDRLQRQLLGAEALALAVWCKKRVDVCWRYLKRYVPKKSSFQE